MIKPTSRRFSADHCSLLVKQNKDHLMAMSKLEWLGVASGKVMEDLVNGQSELMSGQIHKSRKDIQAMHLEATQVRKEVLSSLVIANANIKMATRESVLKEVLPSFAKHSVELLRLPLDTDGVFPQGNEVIASWTSKVQLATLASLANPTPARTSQQHRPYVGKRQSQQRKFTPQGKKPYQREEPYYKTEKKSFYDKKQNFKTQESFRNDKRDFSASKRGKGKSNRGNRKDTKK